MLRIRPLKLSEAKGDNKLRLMDIIMKLKAMSDSIPDLVLLQRYWSDSFCLLDEIIQNYDGSYKIEVLCNDGNIHYFDVDNPYTNTCSHPIIPVIEFGDISDVLINKESKVIEIGNGLKEIQFGYYPQDLISPEEARNLLSNVNYVDENGPQYYSEKEKKTKKMKSCRFEGDSSKYSFFEFDDLDRYYDRGSYTFVKNKGTSKQTEMSFDRNSTVLLRYKPIKWILDEKEKLMVAESPVLCGIPITSFKRDNPESIEDTNLGSYLYGFLDELGKSAETEFLEDRYQENKRENFVPEKKSLYQFSDVPEKKLSPDEELENCIKANIPVMLHGLSGVGKTGRIKSIDPNAQIVSLFTRSKEEILGIVAYDKDSGQVVFKKPNWLEELEEKCRKDSDNIHILFFDEITLGEQDDIQKAAYEIILERTIRDGMWKLPPNVRIVAAGNSENESTVAQDLPAPLFSRLAHVYIDTTPEQWMQWASMSGIHPAIIGYIAYKSSIGEKVLRTKYTGESPHADPRRWEFASEMLKATNLPEALGPIIGDDLTRDFAEFVRTPTYSVEDVIQHPYEMKRELKKLSLDERYPTVLSLVQVDEEHVKEVREAIKCLGPEFVALFENIWIQDKKERMDKIMQIQEIEELLEEGYQVQ